MGVLWSQSELLFAAAEALGDWESAAAAVGVHVEQVLITLLPPAPVEGEPEPPPTLKRSVMFEWDETAGEYAFRTIDN